MAIHCQLGAEMNQTTDSRVRDYGQSATLMEFFITNGEEYRILTQRNNHSDTQAQKAKEDYLYINRTQ